MSNIIKSRRLAAGYWSQIPNQRKFLDELAKKLNISTTDDWYKVNALVFQKNGGSTLLQQYDGSPRKLLTTVYPEYPIRPYLHSLLFNTKLLRKFREKFP